MVSSFDGLQPTEERLGVGGGRGGGGGDGGKPTLYPIISNTQIRLLGEIVPGNFQKKMFF